MSDRELAVIILAAGEGTRMRSSLPKVLHPIAGEAMIAHVLRAAGTLSPAKEVVVVGPGMEAVADAVNPRPCVVQQERLGTAHAALQARSALAGFRGQVLILYGDGPLITAGTLHGLAARQEESGAAFVWAGVQLEDPTGYGRLLLDEAGELTAIVEEKDASQKERAETFAWTGLLLADAEAFFELLPKVGNDNAKGEYYLTSLVELGREAGLRSVTTEASAEEFRGVNSRAELAVAEAIMQSRLRAAAMEAGATLIDPTTVYLSGDTATGRDVTIHPNVVIGPGVVIEGGAEIKSFSHLEGARIGSGAVVGPFARLRPGARIGAKARVGNFVEVKNAELGEGAKANHLTYLGDAAVGKGANVGAGTITCNYDGFDKARTVIGEGAFIGSNSALVAPVTVGRNAIVGAGSVVTEDVPEEALGLSRAPFKAIAGWAAKFRQAKTTKKEDG